MVEGEGAKTRMSKVVELYVYDQFNKVSMDEVPCGDIVAISGIQVRVVSGTAPTVVNQCIDCVCTDVRTPCQLLHWSPARSMEQLCINSCPQA